MVLLRVDYQEDFFVQAFRTALEDEFRTLEAMPVILCIGTNRHMLDCFGPLTGTMLSALVPCLTIIGTLNEPIHAQNLVSQLPMIHSLCYNKTVIAIDAAIGNPKDVGIIQLKRGGLSPGKALSKNLPIIGDYALTAIVGSHFGDASSIGDIVNQFIHKITNKKDDPRSLAPVYQMARNVSMALAEWIHRNYVGF